MKIYFRFVLIFTFLQGQGLWAQQLKNWGINFTQLNFGSCLVNQNTAGSFYVYNYDDSQTLEVLLNVPDSLFKTDVKAFSVMPLDSMKVNINFKPTHNIQYKSVVAVMTNRVPGLVVVQCMGDGKFSDTYYNSTFNLWDENLKTELKKITGQGYVSLGYNTARDNMYGTIDNVGGSVTCVYTGRVAQFNTRAGATANNFNCEHTWPQSMFSSNEPMKSDIHHLFATDESANSKRDNDPFGVVLNPTWQVGGSKWANDVFEPRNEQKGNSARSMFYMAIRYQNYANFLTNQESILRAWSLQFPPNQADLARNNAIHALQKNRNPFVDHPEFLDRIVSISSTSNRALVYAFWNASLNGVQSWPVIKRYVGDTLSAFIHNKGTGSLNITQIVPPANGKLVGNYNALILPGEYTTVSFTETGALEMNKVFTISTDKGNLIDTFRFEIIELGNTEKLPASLRYWYPTPSTTGLVFCDWPNCLGKIKVYNAVGKIVLFTEIRSELDELDLSAMPNGVYFVETMREGVRNTQRLVLQK